MSIESLPIGIQSFRDIRERGLRYVDKTAYAKMLFGGAKHSFLSRPRRFGKSLFVSMLKELFEGNEPLFMGLGIHPDWDWSVKHPVVRLDFSRGRFFEPGGLERNLASQLDAIERGTGLRSGYQDGEERLAYLIETLHQREGRGVVLLVDEYDHPITEALMVEGLAERNRNILRSLYSVTKSHDEYLRLSFFTGVSRFSRAGLFSGANNLRDISLRPEYSAICGYTEADLKRVFGDMLEELNQDEVREWYNGYCWGGERVYNPISILELLDRRKFRPWWLETGTPKFLMDTLAKRNVSSLDIDRMTLSQDDLAAVDIGHSSVEALLFQTGYLTIDGGRQQGDVDVYPLTYPNREVRQGLNRYLLSALLPGIDEKASSDSLRRAMLEADAAGIEANLRRLVAGVSYHWYPRKNKSEKEGNVDDGAPMLESHYAIIIHSAFQGAGLDARGEVPTSRGRVDMVVPTGVGTYLFEIKIAGREPPGAAMRQIDERGYPKGFVDPEVPVLAVGVEIDPKERAIVRFDMERRSFVSLGGEPGPDHPAAQAPGDQGADEPEPDWLPARAPGDQEADEPRPDWLPARAPGDQEADEPEPESRSPKGPSLSM